MLAILRSPTPAGSFARPAERPRIYRLVEGHPWNGNWIEGFFVSDDDIWNALNRSRLGQGFGTLANKVKP